MPQLQQVVLTDRASTPVNHTFVPAGFTPNGAVGVVRTSTGVPLSEKQLTVGLRQSNGKYRGKLVLTVPVVQDEVINGISMPKVVRTAYATVELTFDQSSSLQERKDVVGMLESALASSKVLINDTLTKLESVY